MENLLTIQKSYWVALFLKGSRLAPQQQALCRIIEKYNVYVLKPERSYVLNSERDLSGVEIPQILIK